MTAENRPRVSWGDRLRYWFFTQNSTRTGILWIAAVVAFLFLGGFLALQLRLELASPDHVFKGPEEYAEIFSAHGTFMIFFVAVPVFFGFASAILPRALGTSNVAFPRLNNMDLWLILAGGLTLEVGYVLGQRPIGGWTGYPPLTLEQFQPGHGTDWWIWGIFLETLGTGLAGVNVLVLILRRRRPDMPISRMPLFAWSMLFTSLLVMVAVPFLLTALLLLFLDRNFGLPFYTGTDAQTLLLWQDLFWFYSHPATYVMLIPTFGVVSAILARFSGRPIFSYVLLVAGTAGVWLFSYLVWWHHMFTTGMNLAARTFGSVSTWAVSVFSGVVVFTWLASLWRARIRLTTPMLWALGLIAMFTIGGADGVYMAYVPLDYHFHDTYWLVAHFHYIIIGTTIFGMVAATYYWFPQVLNRKLDERLGKWHFWISIVSFNVAFFPMHNLGVLGMQRRVWTYPEAFTDLNVVATVGAFAFALAQFLLVANVVLTLWKGQVVTDEAWGGRPINAAGPTRDDAEPPEDADASRG